jgi:dienelactone hydrolase
LDPSDSPVVIFIPDIFGVDLVNTKLLADEWAGNGWKVLLPDVLEGDAVPHEHLKAIVPNVRDKAQATLASKAVATATTAAALGPWIVKHREAGMSP